MTRMIYCEKLKKQAEGLDAPPYPGEIGQNIFAKISKPAWKMWIEHQIKLINEYRLSLIDPKAKIFLEKEMIKFLFEGGSATPPGYVPENKD